MTEPAHEPVMAAKSSTLLQPARGGLFVDCTVGLGGHSRALLEAGATRLLGLDRDRGRARASRARRSRRSAIASSSSTPTTASSTACSTTRGSTSVDGVLADLGVSSMQLDAEGRGFSFRRDEPLDMRMDQSRGPTVGRPASRRRRDRARRRDLPRSARSGTRGASRAAIVDARARVADRRPPGELAAIVRRAVPHKGYQRIDPATRTFQALRIWVNRELDGLDAFLVGAARPAAARTRGSPSSRFTRSRTGSSSTRSARWRRPATACGS